MAATAKASPLSKAARCALAALLALSSVAGAFVAFGQRAYAADTAYLEVGEQIPYAGYFTTWMSADGQMAYCADPASRTPDQGSYEKSALDVPSGRNGELRADLYFGWGGPGFDESMWPASWYDGNPMDDGKYAVLTHLIVADTYASDGGYALHGTAEGFRDWCRENVLGFGDDGSVSNPGATGRQMAGRADEVPERFDAFTMSTGEDTQVIASFAYSVEATGTKASSEEWSQTMSCYSLEGAEYGVYASKADAEEDANRIGTVVIGADGTGSAVALGSRDGAWYAKEVKAPTGYALDGNVHKLTKENGYAFSSTDAPKVAPVDVLLGKANDETLGAAQGSTNYLGARFRVAFYDRHLTAEEAASAEPVREWEVVVDGTDAEGRGTVDVTSQLAGKLWSNGEAEGFPLGCVTIEETEAPEGMHADGRTHVVDISDDGGDGTTVASWSAPTVLERTFRGDFRFNKISGDQERLAGIPFKVTSKTTGETHVLVTDANGVADTSAARHPRAEDANGNDAFLADASAELDPAAGIWFSQDANGATSEPDDSRGALPYDVYEVEELACEANAGMRLVRFTVSVSEDGHVIDLGTKTDADGPRIGTTATDAEDGDHEAEADGKVAIVDAVAYSNLKPGKTYKLVGILMDKATGKPVISEDKEVTAEVEFSPVSSDGIAEVVFEFDASAIAGHDVVAFEALMLDNEKVAEHADIDDEGQTVKLTEAPEEPATPGQAEGSKGLPQTGDSKLAAIAGLAALGAAACAAVVMALSRRRKVKDDTGDTESTDVK